MPDLEKIAPRLRVRIGHLFTLLLLLTAKPDNDPALFWWGLLLVVWGVLVRAYSAGYIVKSKELATSGPYAWHRNPLYFGSFLCGLGFALMNGWVAVSVPLLLIVMGPVYVFTIRSEEKYLLGLHGEAFRRYMKNTPRFLPWPPIGRRIEQAGAFRMDQLVRNKEYEGMLGMLGVAFLFWLMMHFDWTLLGVLTGT
jgi:hypothetical protein